MSDLIYHTYQHADPRTGQLVFEVECQLEVKLHGNRDQMSLEVLAIFVTLSFQEEREGLQREDLLMVCNDPMLEQIAATVKTEAEQSDELLAEACAARGIEWTGINSNDPSGFYRFPEGVAA